MDNTLEKYVSIPLGTRIELMIQWVGPASALYFLHYLLLEASADKNGEVAKLLKAFTFTIVPTVNPDGYVHSRQSSRMWRKTRQLVDADRGCLGEFISFPSQFTFAMVTSADKQEST